MLLGKNPHMWMWEISVDVGVEGDIQAAMMISRVIGKGGGKIQLETEEINNLNYI